MGLRPAKCYRSIERPYTRQSRRKPKKGYVKGVPDRRIHKFEMGEKKKEYSLILYLAAERAVQIRHNALEAARTATHKYLTENVGEGNYFLKIMVYPHHILRENALATGAGADRFSTGMRLAFGKPIGMAAQVRPGQHLIEVRTDAARLAEAKKALKLAAAKFPTPCRIVYPSS